MEPTGDADKETEPTEKVDQINAASALWKRPKSELSDDDYKEFYQNLTSDNEEPLH